MRKSLIGLALLVLTCGAVMAQTSMNGPYYANPSWDQQFPATQRFIVLSNWNNAAVLDRETGVVWQRSPFNIIGDGSFSTQDQICREQTTGNRKGWRQPTMSELESLIDPTQTFPGPFLPPGNPFQGVDTNSFYWTTTPAPGFPNQVYIVSLGSGTFTSADATSSTAQHPTWCVRGPSAP